MKTQLASWLSLALVTTAVLAETGPDPFAYAVRSNVATSAVITSEARTVTGFTGTLPVSVAGGTNAQYRIGSGAFTSNPGSISPGQTLSIRHTSATSANTETVTTVIVGDYATPFRSVTGASDRTPEPFDFGTKLHVPPAAFVESDARTPGGFNTTVAIVPGPGAQYSVDGGAWTNVSGSLVAGQSLRMRHLTAAAELGYTRTYLTVGGVTGYFTTRTRSAQNLTPVADAGADLLVDEVTPVALDGGGSSDPEGATLTYAWIQIDGPDVALAGADTAAPTFTAPAVDEDTDLTFELTVADDRGGTAVDQVIVTVLETRVVSIGDLAQEEGSGAMAFRVTVTPAAARTILVDYATADGTARAGADYVGGSGALVLPAGATEALVSVPLIDDAFQENHETFTVGMSNPDGATIGNGLATGTIRDDDDKGLLRVGAAKRVVTPSQQHIDGVVESRVDGTTRLQKFNLGGFGVNPLQNLPDDPFGGMQQFSEALTEPASRRVFEGSRGAEDTHVRVMVLEQADGTRVAFVMLDAVGAGNLVQKGVKEAINAAACAEGACIAPAGTPGEQIGNIVFGQTHTHAGADLQGLWGGVPQDWVHNTLYAQAADAAREAIGGLVPVNLTFQQGQTVQFNNYRRPRYDLTADADGTMTLVKAVADDGTPVGSILQYNAHPVAINEDPRIPHADYIQGALDWLENSTTGPGGVALFYNGPIADASSSGSRAGCTAVPSDADYGVQRCKGEGMASAAQGFVEKPLAPTLAARHVEVTLPITNPGFVALGLIGSFNRYYDFLMLPAEQIPGIGPLVKAEMVNLPQVTPVARTLVSRVTIGGVAGGLEIVTIPGEATNTFGQYIRGLTGNKNMMLLGLTQNSFGYIIPEEEFNYIDPSGDAGLVAPFTGYEENVSLGPLTAPLLRFQGYHPLFDIGPDDARNLPPVLLACQDDPMSEQCVLNNVGARIDYIQRAYANTCRDAGGPEGFCQLFDPQTPLYDMCKNAGFPEETCRALGAPGGGADNPDSQLAPAAAEAVLRGCDLLDPSNCLLPFPSDHFTAPAAPNSPQGVNRGGTGRRINFNALAMPRNLVGKPIDPSEWNRNDGFSPGQQIITLVPNVATVKGPDGRPTGPIVGAPPITDIGASLDVAGASVVVLDTVTGQPHPVWAEIDLNAGYLLPADEIDNPNPAYPPKPALIVRPGKNFAEGRRYVVVLKNLKHDTTGATLPAGAAFRTCRDGLATALPPVQERCAALNQRVFPVLEAAGIGVQGNAGLYLAWDFTTASAANNIGRLRHMRDDAFVNYLGQVEASDGSIVQLGRAPMFKVTSVSESGGRRTVQGSITVPSYVVPADPSPLERERDVRQALKEQFPQFAGPLDALNAGRQAFAINAPPNRLHYLPDPTSADACEADAAQVAGGCASQARYGDGLPDRTGEMTTTFTCSLPANASPATRPIVYGHGLLGGQEERGADNEYDMMYCKADWFGFAFGDVPNVVTVLADVSNFPVIPDASQQGMINQLFLARLLRHPQGFIADPAFRDASGQPLFDNREVFYDGNSQGGILGGVVVAMSKDITRGVLGVVGMNYSTLLQRSVDYDGRLQIGIPPYSLPTYLAYQDDLDRQLVFSIMQMLWDRSENNGYAHHMTDNSALKGPDNQVLLHPAFADHQVTHWSAQVMARTVGVDVADLYQRKPDEGAPHRYASKFDFFAQRDPDSAAFWALPLVGRDAGAAYDTAGCAGTACRTARSAFVEFDEGRTAIPPIGNVPPRADSFDPHGWPRGTIFGRCQKSHFLHTQGRIIDVRGERNVTSAANCPALPPAVTPPTVPVGGDDAIPPFPLNPCAPDPIPGIGGECLLDAPVIGDALQAVWTIVNGGEPAPMLPDQCDPVTGENCLSDLPPPVGSLFEDPGEPPPPSGNDPVEQAIHNAQTLPAGLAASLQQTAANAANGALAERSAEAVVMEGRQFPDWSQPAAQGVAQPYPNGALTGNRDAHAGIMLYPPAGFAGVPTAAPVREIVAYKRENDAWVEIPVQVDERFPYFLANPNSDFGIYSGTDMELTYAWDVERWKADGVCAVDPATIGATPDPVAGLDDDDEIAFMARDAGEFADPTLPGPEGTVGTGQEIALTDPLKPDAPRFVYLFRKPAGPTFSIYYVDYARDANADQWIDRTFFEGGPDTQPYERNAVGTSNTGYGPNLSGPVCWDGVTPHHTSNDRFPRDGVRVSTDTYQLYASGRWMVRDVRVAKPGQPRVYGPDIVDRWKGRAFQQSPDSTISLVGFEDEQVNWEANSALLGERVGPVRAIREIWGADSGTNVTKTETYYSDAYVYRYRMRVHPIPPDGIYTSWDYNRGAMVAGAGDDPAKAGRYFTAVRGTGVPIDGENDDVGNFDGVGSTPAYFDVSDPTLNLPLGMYNWEQVAAKNDFGSLVYLFELKSPTIGANSAVIPYYRDDACLDDGTGDDPVGRPWPGESSTDAAVRNAYSALAGGTPYEQLRCDQKQGAHAQHGIHMLLPPETDNAFAPVPVNEVDGQQWAFPVPMSQPTNVGERYANIVRAPLVRTVRPRPSPGGGGGDGLPGDYATCVAMAAEGGDAQQEAAARFACAVIFGGGRGEGEDAEDEIQGPNRYVPMSDGTLIATNIYIPWKCNAPKNPDAVPCPVILEMSGYESGSDEGQTPAGDVNDIVGSNTLPLSGGTRASHEKYYRSGERYVSVTASVRGTGCSAGEFDLFSPKSAQDGYELVEWLADQPWSNGKVGIFGHSYSGITGAMIAATNPPSLEMVTISGQIGDIYRDITYPGGVSNYGFPLLWTGAVRPAYDYLGGTFAGLIADSPRSADDPFGRQCARNQAARSRTLGEDPLIRGSSDVDGPWFQERSVVNRLHNVRAPTQVVTAYQDEQTGPRGGTNVFDHLPQNLTRRLVMLNGDHGSQTGPAEVTAERRYWMDRFMLDADDPNPQRRPRTWSAGTSLPAPQFADDGTATSRVLLEVNTNARSNGHIDSTGFPLAQTQWTDFYFQVDGTLDAATSSLMHGEAGSGSTWFNGSKRQAYSYQAGTSNGAQGSTADAGGADELIFTLDVDAVAQSYTATNGQAHAAWVVAGPIMADLYITTTAPDTELMVQLIDADPATGERLYLQRGVLRASHDLIEPQHSQCAAFPAGGRITGRDCTLADNLYRPHRAHTAAAPVTPGEVRRYRLEIWPVGHVFRAGHELLVKIHAPSADDNDWAYISKAPPALNTLHHSVQYPSSLRLPVAPLTAVSRLGSPTPTCSDDSMRCVIVAGGASLGEDPSTSWREECHDFGENDPTPGKLLKQAFCGTFDTLAGVLFDQGGGGAEPGPGTAVGAATGTVFDTAAGAYQSAIGSDGTAGPGGRVRAGVGVVDMTPDVGYGAGQYSAKRPDTPNGEVDPYATHKTQAKSVGVQMRLTGRAIVVEGANGKRVALLKSDNYLAQDHLLRRIAAILAEHGSSIGYEQILHHVTHAHSTTYVATPSWGVWAFQDAFDARFFEFQARKLAEAILLAEGNLQPARMGATTVRHKVFKGQIMRPSTGDDGTPVQYPDEYGDLGLVVMRFETDDAERKPIAVWVNWGEHPEGLDGYDLHSPDFVGFLERFVDRDLGAPLVFSQGDVGSAERSGNTSQRIADDGQVCQGPGAVHAGCAAGEGVWRDWNHNGYVQNERNVRFLADAVVKGWRVIGGEQPPDPATSGIRPNDYVAEVQVPLSNAFPVDYRNAFVPGPLSHPYPSVSNCRSEPTAGGDTGVPIIGLPDCQRTGFPGNNPVTGQLALIWATLHAEGVPLPEHYDAPSFTGVQENLRLKLQAFRLGEVLLGSCACEAQVDLILNFETRADDRPGNIYDGFDWACLLPEHADDPQYAAACATQKAFYDPAEFPVNVPGTAEAKSNPAKIARMRAQIHNDARGWDAPEYAPYANAEPADPALIKGNFTKEELPAAQGYKLVVGIGHAGDYNGYTVSYREYMSHDHYRKALTSHGPHTADYMVTRLVRMAGAMKGAPELQPEPLDGAAQADEARQVAASTALGQSTKHAYEGYYAALPPDVGPEVPTAQPNDIGYFNAATFQWRGGSTAVDNPQVVVERCNGGSDRACTGGTWQAFADQTGEVQTRVQWPSGPTGLLGTYAGQREWLWTANFEAYEAFPARLGSTPGGFYRFVVEGCINDYGAPEQNVTNRITNVLAGLLPAGTVAPRACLSGARRYAVASATFEVVPGRDRAVRTVTPDMEGDLAIEVETRSIPLSYVSVFPYIHAGNDVPAREYCRECSFRPWAYSAAGVQSVDVTVDGDAVPVTGADAIWNADANLAPGQAARITVTYRDGRQSRPYVYMAPASTAAAVPDAILPGL